MVRPRDEFPRSCLRCLATNKRHVPPRRNYARGLCEKHYRQEHRKKPKCKAAGCTTRLVPGYSREGYCRMDEPLLLVEPIRTPEAMRRTLDKFRDRLRRHATASMACLAVGLGLAESTR